jgi:light-regulated signal transduction histidine kinase (bacteriophytochrome)
MSEERNPSPLTSPVATESLQQQVLSLQQQLAASQRELEAFTYAVSHDLRAPLRSLSGFSQALAELPNAGLDTKAEHYLNRIQQASRRMSELIDALLVLARISRADMQIRAVDFSALCNEAVVAMRNKYAGRNVTINIQPDIHLQADSRLLRAALDALLDNAFKFTGTRDTASIDIGHTDTQYGKAYFVRDNGVGFDMSYAEKLFRPFQRLHADERFSGLGIGLATAQRVVMRHGGKIWTESQVEQGTTVFFTLS